MGFIVIVVTFLFWAVCLLVPAATYLFILVDLFKYVAPRVELHRRIFVGGALFAVFLGGLWIWNYQVSMLAFSIPFLVAPPLRLVQLIVQAIKGNAKWDRIEITKVVLLSIVSFFCLALICLVCALPFLGPTLNHSIGEHIG